MKKLNLSKVIEMAQNRGLKMTPQRRAIIEFLETAEHHPTADEVFFSVNERFPMTSRATVYNTLNWLKESKMLQEVFEAGQVRFDPNIEHHHHFICRKCSKVEDVGFDLISSLGICEMPNSNKIEGFEIVLRGVCINCQQK
jgi:Fur family transcriptional regulator, peroxide stress response regulator